MYHVFPEIGATESSVSIPGGLWDDKSLVGRTYFEKYQALDEIASDRYIGDKHTARVPFSTTSSGCEDLPIVRFKVLSSGITLC